MGQGQKKASENKSHSTLVKTHVSYHQMIDMSKYSISALVPIAKSVRLAVIKYFNLSSADGPLSEVTPHVVSLIKKTFGN